MLTEKEHTASYFRLMTGFYSLMTDFYSQALEIPISVVASSAADRICLDVSRRKTSNG